MELILVRIVSAIIVPIAKPIWLDANRRGFALQVVLSARDILVFARFEALVAGGVVFAIIDAIAHLENIHVK